MSRQRWRSTASTSATEGRSVAELAADIRDWVEHWNTDPKSFVWHKTADEILERLAGYCTAVTTE